MKNASIFIILLMTVLTSNTTELDVSDLLKMHLGDSIIIKSANEIWYCPDNTCELYKAENSHPYFSYFVYLNLYHNPSYLYLSQSLGDSVPFLNTAIEEPRVRNTVTSFCSKAVVTPKCILEGLTSKLKIKVGSGRYDEGYFCYGFEENENICNKL
mgnify:FL=1